MASIADGIQRAGAVAGIQIGHAGRKASANTPWEGDDHMAAGDPRAWQPIAPSAIAYGGELPRVPVAMGLPDIARVKADFVAAARRAHGAGFKWLELHFAHGYLEQSFFSAHSNQRTDQYGGSFDNRARFLLETLAAVREVWPENLPLAVRLGVIEYDGKDEQTVAESIELARRMRTAGLDFLNVTINFVIAETKVPWATEAFLAPIAQRVRNEAGLPVASARGMDAPHTAERLIRDEQMDLVMMGRAHLTNPHYAYHLALALGQAEPEGALPAAYAHWLSTYRGAARP
jgi:2,4-dienoyl-CoA reductase-like NADH-dependent reductase (Old Yellow Enzyme family)